MSTTELRPSQEGLNSSPDTLNVGKLAFPDHARLPSTRFQCRGILRVSLLVPQELRSPIPSIRSRYMCSFAARMHVPETAMNEDDLTSRRKNQVRLSRKVFPVQPVTIAHPMYEATHCHFRACVFGPDGTHVGTSVHS